ncbi:MAG: imidazole glycerol phosphate synthase subunit HisH [Acidaminococcus intestini]|uniref:Imidazole glycerol phosphate synthase subunit HisH n=1 Tax=Acidaminococcus intestini TaxID=187327 RepID=A0A943I1W5_9FIRM|nr:imidazole glycerol phosphate synthase subunit HisH [Acidaminococcus intestini]
MNNQSIAIIDYGRGNLHSVYYGLKKIGADPIITNDEKTILEAPRVILPGVGAFGDCMDHLAASGLEDAIFHIIEKGTPFLGICVGLQLLFEGSEETPGVKGLGIFKGMVRLIRTSYKIPHMGWNELTITRPSPLLKDAEGKMVYFVHSFAADPCDRNIITATTDYGTELVAAVGRGNVQGFQFHPEKSSAAGLAMLKAFKEWKP